MRQQDYYIPAASFHLVNLFLNETHAGQTIRSAPSFGVLHGRNMTRVQRAALRVLTSLIELTLFLLMLRLIYFASRPSMHQMHTAEQFHRCHHKNHYPEDDFTSLIVHIVSPLS